MKRSCVAVLAAIGVAFLLVGWTPLANVLAMPLLRVASSPARADAAVVMSEGRYSDGSLTEASIERAVTGARLYHEARVARLLFSGGPCCGRSASALMAQLAHGLGVPRAAILLEEHSTRTWDGARYSAELLRRDGVPSAILVTSPLHLVRAQRAFAAAGFPVYPVRASETDLTRVSGVAERIALLHDAVHEYLGLAFYRLQGWI
jgi:uncharacterized SAM-binding protein YcdF (DUF218 family)